MSAIKAPQQPASTQKTPKMASHASTSHPSLFPPIPGPLQRLFDLVPLMTYPANSLPGDYDTTASGSLDDGFVQDVDVSLSALPTLYVFIDPADAARGRASFNPTCLKWQTFLRFADIPVNLAASSNHASPTGALPFLQPARTSSQTNTKTKSTTPQPPRPVPAHDLPSYVKKLVADADKAPSTMRDHPKAAAYQALLDTSLRRAWLHAVYLDESAPEGKPQQSIATRLYAHAASTSLLVRSALAGQLRTAAAAEVWGSSSSTQAVTASATAQIYRDAEAALAALSTILDGSETGYFFGSSEPSLFDAAVFSYTHLLLEDGDNARFPWHNRVLPDLIQSQPRLVEHRNRIVERYWSKQGAEATSEKTPGQVDTTASWIRV